MAVNNLTTEQSYAFLTSLYEQATGKASAIAVVDSGTFTTVAQAVQKTSYDTVLTALSKVIGKTIFDVRPYSSKFKGIDMDAERWGAYVRKISFADTPIETDQRLNLVDGQSIDQWKVQKPKPVELCFYGETEYSKHITIFKDQLDTAFQNAEEFGSFISGVLQNVSDHLEQIKEEEARSCLINFITGKKAGDSANCINVLQAYYNETGVQLTPVTMYNEDNYVPFVKWLYSFINTLTDDMAERSFKFHINLTNKEIPRHTPANKLKAYMSSMVMNKIDSAVMSSIFNPEKLKAIDFEKVSFWQSINDKMKVSAKPTYLQANGTLATSSNAVTVSNVLGVIFDEEALGITRHSTWVQSTGMNAAGGYSNLWYHFRQTVANDFTQNGVVLYADTVSA